MAKQSPSFYTVEQVADRLQLHWQTILDFIRAGELEAIKLGKGYRIPFESFDRFVQARIAAVSLDVLASSEKFSSKPKNPKHARYRSVLVVPATSRKGIISFGLERDKKIQEIIESGANLLSPKPDLDGLVDDRVLDWDGREIYFRLTEDGIVFLRGSLTEPEDRVYIGFLLTTIYRTLKITKDVYKEYKIELPVLVRFRMEGIENNLLEFGTPGRNLSLEDRAQSGQVEVNEGPIELGEENVTALSVKMVQKILRGFGNNRIGSGVLSDFLQGILEGKE
jgi:excisionase family DNA binding protein